MRASNFSPLGSSCGVIIAVVAILPYARPTSPQTSNEYDRALAAFRTGDYSRAADLFAETETAFPGATPALLYKSKCLVHMQDFAAAERPLRSYLDSHHNSDEALYLLGYVLHRQNKPRESLEVYTKAAALKRPAGDDLKIVGLDYVLLNDYPDAIHWLAKAVVLEPNNKDAWYCLGRAYYTESRLPEARKAFRTVLDLDPRDVKAETNLGLIFEAEAKPDEALKAYRQAMIWQQANPHPNEQPLVNLGSLLTQQGHLQEAIPYLERAVALADKSGFCHLKLGMAYLRAGRLEDARRELEKATELEPDNVSAHYHLGRVYQAMHAPDRAKMEFDRTQELQSRAAGVIRTPAKH